jgi:hypothetical protein
MVVMVSFIFYRSAVVKLLIPSFRVAAPASHPINEQEGEEATAEDNLLTDFGRDDGPLLMIRKHRFDQDLPMHDQYVLRLPEMR